MWQSPWPRNMTVLNKPVTYDLRHNRSEKRSPRGATVSVAHGLPIFARLRCPEVSVFEAIDELASPEMRRRLFMQLMSTPLQIGEHLCTNR